MVLIRDRGEREKRFLKLATSWAAVKHFVYGNWKINFILFYYHECAPAIHDLHNARIHIYLYINSISGNKNKNNNNDDPTNNDNIPTMQIVRLKMNNWMCGSFFSHHSHAFCGKRERKQGKKDEISITSKCKKAVRIPLRLWWFGKVQTYLHHRGFFFFFFEKWADKKKFTCTCVCVCVHVFAISFHSTEPFATFRNGLPFFFSFTFCFAIRFVWCARGK